jgi:hypothetical protein
MRRKHIALISYIDKQAQIFGKIDKKICRALRIFEINWNRTRRRHQLACALIPGKRASSAPSRSSLGEAHERTL